MNILVLFDNTKKFCMLFSAVCPILREKYPASDIEIVSSSDYCRKFLSHIPGISSVNSDIALNEYDVVYCFDDSISHLVEFKNIKCNKYVGYSFSGNTVSFSDHESELFFNHYCLKSKCETNILSSLFDVFGLSWNREGFNIRYSPKSKSKEDRSGVAISNGALRLFVKNNLFSGKERLWHVPIRHDPLKMIDEVNKCSNLVTDNIFCSFIGSFLRKKVIFLVKEGCQFTPGIFDDVFVQSVSAQVIYEQD